MTEKILADLKESYKHKPHRIDHVIGVRDTAIMLGKLHNVDTSKLEKAALLHDITKYYTTKQNIDLINSYFDNARFILEQYNEHILHAFSAVVVAHKKYGISDPDILGAIQHHTIGKPAMNIYEKILFVSDYIEPNRVYESCIKVREIAFKSLDKAVYTAIDDSITYYQDHGGDIPTVAFEARDYYKRKLEEMT